MSARGFVVLLVLSGLVPGPIAVAQDSPAPGALRSPLQAGTKSPSFALDDINGKTIDISRYLGKSPIVLSFWSIYCDSCVDEMLALQKLEDKYRGDGLVILAINEDIRVPISRISRFMERLEKFRGKITYSLLFDKESRVFNQFKVSSLPTLVLVDKDGMISGYFRGFDPEGERDLLARIEGLVKGKDEAVTATALLTPGRSEVITVSGEATLCGFFDESGWRKSFTGNEDLDQEMELTGDLSRRDAGRRAVTESLRMLGVNLYSNDPRKECMTSSGIHLHRDPYDTGDPVSNLLARIQYADFFETLKEQEMLIGETYYTNREVRVSIESLERELESIGYLFEPLRITFTYVNMGLLDQKEFLMSLLSQSRFIGRVENPVFTPVSTSQVFEVYTSSQGFADEILSMDFGPLQVFIEEVTSTSLELEVWK